MKKLLAIIFSTSIVILAGCTTIPTDDIKVNAEADPKANFKGYKSYAWLGSAGILKDPEGKWEPPKFDADAEITYLINRELRARGLTETTNNPDLIVAYALGVDMAALKAKTKPDSKNSVLENVPQGALMVVLADGKTGYVIWAGAATAEIKNLGPDVAKQRLEYAITNMLNKIPK